MDLAIGLENAASVLGGLFDFLSTPHHYYENEADFLIEQANKERKPIQTQIVTKF